MSDDAPAWRPDPTGRFQHRYWDGAQWTDHVSNAGVASTDPYAAPSAAEPTVAQPQPEPTAIWPAPPPATFPPPGDAALAAASAGSKKGLLIGVGLLAAVAAVVAAVALRDDGDSDRDRIRAAMAAEMTASGDVSQEQADCLANAVIDDLGTDKLKDVDFSADEPPAEIADALSTSVIGSLEACNVDASALAGTDTTDTTDFAVPPGIDGFDGELPADREERLAEVYESSLGLPREKARCLAGKIREAVSSGDLSEEEAMTDIVGFLSACDINLNELTGN